MATSGYTSVAATKYDTLKFSWSVESQSVADNTTTISWKMELIAGTYGKISSTASKDWSVTVNGVKTSGTNKIGIANNATKTLASGTSTIAHNDDGSKTFSYSFSQEFAITFDGVKIGTKSGSGSGTLDTIARASQPSCITYPNHTQDVGYFGDTISIHMNRKSSSFTHRVRWKFGNLTGSCTDAETGKAANSVGTGFKWKIPESFMDQIPNAPRGSGTIYVDTYNGSTKIGTKSCGFTAIVPSSVKPKCSIQVLDNTPHKEFYGNLIKGLSKLHVKTTGTPSYSSPIDSYSVTANGVKYTANEIVTGVLSKAGTTTVSATVKDERGRVSDVASASFTVLDYNAPAITKLSAVRCNEDGTPNKRGSFAKVTFSATVTNLNNKNNDNKNTALYYLKYKPTTDVNDTTVGLTSLTNNYAPTDEEVIFEAVPGKSYDVSIVAVDRHNSSNPTTRSAKVPTASAIISWRGFKKSSGTEDGIGIGKVPEKANTLEVGWDAEFDKPVIFKQNKYCFSSIGEASTDGYIKMARITVTATNADTPITFVFTRRKATTPMTVHVLFKSTADTDPGLASIRYEGENYDAYITSPSASVWDLYVRKVNNSDTITMNDWYTSYRQMNRFNIEFPGGIASSVPTGRHGYYKATPAILQSIVDFMLPVGTIIHRHDHADPNDMYPGTTWERIENTFLWGCDASGTIGQTGGEKTHTLSTAEIPSHSHGAVYSADASGSKNLPWLSTSVLGTGDKLAYSIVPTGGSEAHNNMPPYTQVSIWRRTA